ncbi:PSD1 and planctomycete cytochrome C domain-containing protein [Tautonia plasticadhaerens]|uniref:Planctomycete cytochrome C n=1 Tax=Tautonia plasticadhaerens TaxID=2527974 RepID=A0A518GWV7_9BACT|nr:PSD1 and planctomycete cytochrome C domain-containing protein [Tautonia plasticadhaerens]QDV33031.1 Planctomycete cytochrome C [Tautonia plasticadhaerens]
MIDPRNSAVGPGRHSRHPAVLFAVVLGWGGTSIESRATDDFEREVAPVLLSRCVECHNPGERSGGLDLTTREGLVAGGVTGPVVEPGDADGSYLLARVDDGEMPHPEQGQPRPLSAEEVGQLRRWIEAGAGWPEGRTLDRFERTTDSRAGRDWWSLRPIERPGIPAVRGLDRVSTPVDSFILERLEANGWEPSPRADRRTLIRRVSVDLVGLPPSFEQVEAFAADDRPDAYERLVDRLLASPHYGERWGRHWLDVARYAETSGYERDQLRPDAWKYRDWVVDAFNDDLPFDRFVLEQLAGDELPDRSERTAIATGFLRLGTWNDEPNDPDEYTYERLEDLVHASSTAFLGMTVKCARCHDHKFDPIRQEDYYRVAAAFWAGFVTPGPRELLGGPPAEAIGYEGVLGWTDRDRTPPPFFLLRKGDPGRPGPEVGAGPPSMVEWLDRPFRDPPEGARTSHRRLQLARWIVDPANPLTARVWANRIWQHHFGEGIVRSPDNFGFTGEPPTHPELLDWLASELIEGGWSTKRLHRLIVLSRTYQQASAPEGRVACRDADPSNRSWWRADRRRLDAESLRDALLLAGGRLERHRLGGPSFAPEIAGEALEGLSMKGGAYQASPAEEQRRRSVYILAKRGLLHPLMTTFDFMDTTLPCGRRDVTLVPPQALTLLNNAFVHEQSTAAARGVLADDGGTEGRIRGAWRRILARDPRDSEVELAREHLRRRRDRPDGPDAELWAMASLCHVLMNTNEFLYVD